MNHNLFFYRRINVLLNHCAKQKAITRPASSFTNPEIRVSKSRALVDEKVCITATGLLRGQKVTLQTFVKDGDNVFGACGHYIANNDGKVDTFRDECQGGTYDGIEPMGLFWSMQSSPGSKPRRIINSDVTSPFKVRIALHDDFKSFEDLPWNEGFPSLASCIFHQMYKAPGVRVIPVKEDGLLGTLCLPPGEGPFPAVIDIFGMTHLYPSHRSALLASNGIASFVIAYVANEGLPDSAATLDFSYFLKAWDWLSRHPSINPDAMGGITSCIGGGYGTIIAWKRPSMKCLVGLNTCVYPSGPRQMIEGDLFEETLDWRLHRAKVLDDGISFRPLCTVEDNAQALPYWRHGIKVLYVQGLDDLSVDPDVLYYGHAAMPENMKDNIQFIRYPGAGHIIEPPYMPLCRSNYMKIFKQVHLWGGQPKPHAHAQMDSWPRVVAFLKEHLMPATTTSHQTIVSSES